MYLPYYKAEILCRELLKCMDSTEKVVSWSVVKLDIIVDFKLVL